MRSWRRLIRRARNVLSEQLWFTTRGPKRVRRIPRRILAMRHLFHRGFRLLRLEAVAIVLAAGLLPPASALAANEVFAVNSGAGTVSPFSVGASGALTLIDTSVTS